MSHPQALGTRLRLRRAHRGGRSMLCSGGQAGVVHGGEVILLFRRCW